MKLNIEKKRRDNIEDNKYELVERKGVGHPDTICDAIAEVTSRNYLKFCIEKFGKPAHYWFDKVMLIGGESDLNYGKGNIVKPYKVIFAGKVSNFVGKEKIPVEDILYKSVVEVLENTLTGFDGEKHVIIHNNLVDYQGAGRGISRYQPESILNLPSIDDSRVSNDTNLLSGYAPLSNLENLVLKIEKYINGKNFKQNFFDTGWDVKVFGIRKNDKYKLVISVPFLARHIKSKEHYFQRKEVIYNDIVRYIKRKFNFPVELEMNTTDRNGLPYLTALGSVADTGDVGVVGRGNRINGLITPMRPMSIEAPSGKNSIDHTGKIYAVLANELANEIYKKIKIPLEVHIFTTKEQNINKPDEIIVNLNVDNLNAEVENIIKNLVYKKLKNISCISYNLINKNMELW